MLRLPTLLSLSALLGALFSPSAFAIEVGDGVLDRPVPQASPALVISTPAAIVVPIASPEKTVEALRSEFEQEQDELELLPRNELQELAEQGERAAQVTLAEDFAQEASLLAFAPAAANDAMSDAVRWYALAAKRGFPGAPSLDLAGVRVYPMRVQRSR